MKRLISLFVIISLFIPSFSNAASFNIFSRNFVIKSGNQFQVFKVPAIAGATGLIDKAEGGTITLGSGVLSNTATLSSSYDMTRSSIFFLGVDQNTVLNTASSSAASLYGTNSTTITATRGTAVTDTLIVGYYIVQWSVGVTKSVQRVETVVGSGSSSGTASISSVVTANSFVNTLGSNSVSSNSIVVAEFRNSLTNSTTITSTRGVTTDTASATSQVTEFNAGYTNSIQEETVTMTAVNTNTATISAVTTGESMLFNGGFSYTSMAGNTNSIFSTQELTNSTTVTGKRNGSAANNISIGTVVDFNPAYLNSNTQSFNVVVPTALTGTASISSVTTSKSLLSWNGMQNSNGTSANLSRVLMYLGLTNSTTVTGTKGSNASAISTSTGMLLESK